MFAQMARLGFDIDTRSIKDANRELERMPKAAGQAEKSARGMTSAMGLAKRAAGMLATALSVREIVRYADTWSDLSSRVQIAIGRHQDASAVMGRLSDVARMTYSSLEATADSFARNSFVLKALGKSTQEQLDFTEALNNAMVVSGAKGQAMEMVQNSLGRAMAEGTLRSQELQNVMNYGSRVAEILAQELGVNVTQLRQLATDGKITGDVIYSALVKNMELLREEAESMPATVGDAFILIRNAVLETVGVFDQQEQISEDVAESLIRVADAIRNIDTSGLAEFARNSRYEFEQLFVVMGAAATIIQGGFGFGGLQVIQDALATMKSHLQGIKLDKIARDVDRLTDNTALFGQTAEDVEKQMLANGETLMAYFAAQEKAVPITKEAAKALKEAEAAAKLYERQLQSLTDKIYPQKAAVRGLMEEYQLLVRAIKQGDAEASIVHDWLDAEVAIKNTHRAVKELADEAGPFEDIWKNTTQRVQGWFADTFYDILDKGKITFDSLLDMFKRMAAEMMAQRIMISIGGMMGGGNAFAGALGGGGGGGGLMGNIFSVGSWISAGKTLWQGFSGLATGQGLSGFSGILGRFGADAAFESAALKGGLEAAWAQADAAASMSKFANTVGPILAGIGGAIQGWQSGNRANAVTGAIGGWGGAKAGAAAGTYILPGIGTAIGAVIGGILGSSLGSSVFGGDWENRRSGIQLGFDEEGLNLEDWIRQTKKGGWFSSTKRRYVYSEMEEAMAEEFRTGYDTMIDVLGTQFMAIGADLDRAVFEAVKIGSVSINTSDQTEEEIQEQIEKWFNDLQAAMIQGALNASGDTSAAVLLLRATGGDTAMLEALGGLMGVAGINAVQQARDAQTQLTMVESYRAVTEATRTLISEYDGSLDATLGLTEAMAIQQEMAFGMATAYLQASDAVSILFGNLSENIRMSLMGAEELYEYQRQQVHTLADALATMTDPEQILATTQQIERLVSQLWSGLDEDQRQDLGQGYLEFLDRAESLAQTRLDEGLKTVEQTQAELVSGMRDQLAQAASEMMQAALEQREAAQMNLMSANQMDQILRQYGINYAPEVNG